MSKIYNTYIELKKRNKNMMYLFRSGNFYIFLGEDADKINEYVVLKRTPFCKEAIKCGFPVQSLEAYLKVFRNHKLPIEVVESAPLENNFDVVIKKLQMIDLNSMTPIEAFIFLKEIKELLK